MSVITKLTKPLRPGQRLTVKEFLRRWESMPDVKFAELIDGVVYMPSPQTSDHGPIELRINAWLALYVSATPGCDAGSQSTWLMLQSAPQPDSYLWILPECGGQSGIRGNYHTGAPELAAEICFSSGSYDLGVKKSLYERAGVQEYVAFLVEEQEIRWHRLSGKAYKRYPAPADRLYRSKVFPGLWLDSRALWKHDLPRLLRTLERGLRSAEHTAFVNQLAAG